MSASTRIAMIGAGNVGGPLGVRFARAGFPVRFGTTGKKDLAPLLAECDGNASAGTAEEAAQWGEIIVLAVPGPVTIDVARQLAGSLAGKVVVDCNNPLKWQDGPVWTPPAEGSLTAAIAAVAPGSRVVKAFNTFGAEFHKDPSHAGPPAQLFLAGDDAEAKKILTAATTTIGFESIDAGPLRNAAVLENLAMLWIHLATVGGQGRDFILQMVRRGA